MLIVRYTIKNSRGQMVQSGYYDHDCERDRYGFDALTDWAYDNAYVVSTWVE